MADTAKQKTPPPPKKKPTGSGGSKRSLWITLVAAGAVAIVIAGVLVFLSQRGGESSQGADAADVAAGKLIQVDEVQQRFAGIEQNGSILGDPNAPVTITEFADLRCPACKSFAVDQLPTVIDDVVKTGKAKYEFRLWPILGEDSVRAAQAAIAAQQQDKLFEYQDLWYLNQQNEADEYATPAYVDGVAKALGLDLPAFQTARADEALWSPEIQDVQVIAAQRGFGGTPSFVITGPGGERVLSGQVPEASAIVQAVEEVS